MSDAANSFEVWAERPGARETLYECKVCPTRELFNVKGRKQHETGKQHKRLLKKEKKQIETETISSGGNGDDNGNDDSSMEDLRGGFNLGSDDFEQQVFTSAAYEFAHSLAHPSGSAYSHPHPSQVAPAPAPFTLTGYGIRTDGLTIDPKRSERDIERAVLSGLLIEELIVGNGDMNSDGEEDEESDGESEADAESEGSSDEEDEDGIAPDVRARSTADSFLKTHSDHMPWPDKAYCILDIIMHLPRTCFSESQAEMFLFMLRAFGVKVPTNVKTVKNWCDDAQSLYGIDSIPYDGVQGHRYYVNSLGQIIAQEFNNPNVRPHLSFLPEDSGPALSEARQAKRWLSEMPPELTTPWQSHNGKDYFIFEPAYTVEQGAGNFRIPVRWFEKRTESGAVKTYAKCWGMQAIDTQGGPAWRALSFPEHEVCLDDFVMPFPDLERDMTQHPDAYPHLPLVSRIAYLYDASREVEAERFVRWTFTNESGVNPWRVKAKGYPCVAVPVYLYCDDTSGNKGKKWNKHHSWLFTLTGLPRWEASKEYNVHFLSVSNIAPPLEMLDGIVDQFNDAQRSGVWAWDSERGSPVMFFPVVYALLGDNPMQSEMANHIGLAGRLFCRSCKVSGSKGLHNPAIPKSQRSSKRNSRPSSPTASPSRPSSPQAPPHGPHPLPAVAQADNPPLQAGTYTPPVSPPAMPNTAHAPDELEDVPDSQLGVDWICHQLGEFIRVGEPRNADDTRRILYGWFNQSRKLGNETKINDDGTPTGVKDTFQKAYLEKVFESYKGTPGLAQQAKQRLLDECWARLDGSQRGYERMINPVWRLHGIDAHEDTPVEILHVVLLGVVKYFWRDAIRNQLKDRETDLNLVVSRLASVDVKGLGIARPPGKAFVQFAGSLVGKDFRVIAQVAPFVLHGLISPESYETWKCLSKLVPLIYQHHIPNVDEHVALLRREIHELLLRTAHWTGSWFQKPKFHILTHLPDHIVRFGPAIGFATETFESYNAVIRMQSINSNRRAPSRDIAAGFAHWNRIRHIASGGRFMHPTFPCVSGGRENFHRPAFSPHEKDWRTLGPRARLLVELHPLPLRMGVPGAKRARKRRKTSYKVKHDQRPVPYSQCKSSKYVPGFEESGTQRYLPCVSFRLDNHDMCRPNFHVVVRPSIGEAYIGLVEEILARSGGGADPSGVLVRRWRRVAKVNSYDMPSIEVTDIWSVVPPKEVVCLVNTQHDCADRHCDATGRENIMQEGVITDQTRAVIGHKHPLDQLVLNTASMQDAHHIQQFRLPSQPFNEERTLHHSAEALWVLRSTRARKTAAARAATRSPHAGHTNLPASSASSLPNSPNSAQSSQPSGARRRADPASSGGSDTLDLLASMWQGASSLNHATPSVHVSRPVAHRVHALRGEAAPKRRRPE